MGSTTPPPPKEFFFKDIFFLKSKLRKIGLIKPLGAKPLEARGGAASANIKAFISVYGMVLFHRESSYRSEKGL